MPRGSIILLAGYPGAGKTTLATQFAYEGVRNGERVLYVSFVEPKEDFYRNSANFGINLTEAESKGLFKYYEALNVSTPRGALRPNRGHTHSGRHHGRLKGGC